MAEREAQSQLKDKPLESQLEIFELAEKYFEIQSRLGDMYSIILFPKQHPNSTLIDTALHHVLAVARTSLLNLTNIEFVARIREKVRDLRLQVEEQKNMEELLQESGDLKEMVIDLTDSSRQDVTGSKVKRSPEDYDAIEQQALRVVRTCKRLKGTESSEK